MRFLIIGDVFAKPGRDAVRGLLPQLRAAERIDVVVANAENSAGGLGTTPETAQDLLTAGVDVLTGGNHTWKHREFNATLEQNPAVLRPLNYPQGAPGRGLAEYSLPDGRRYTVINLLGRIFMESLENPFLTVDRALSALGDARRVILVDFHAEATSEKRALAHYLDGRVSLVYGTHTHVPTADEEILPGGTGTITDVGMTGPYASVIGLDPQQSVTRFITNRPTQYRVAERNVQLRGLIVEIDDASGHASEIRRITQRSDGCH